MQFKSLEPGIEVNGMTVYSIVDGFRVMKNTPEKILMDRGIGSRDTAGKYQLDRGGWYAQQDWLDAFREIAESLGDRVLHQIGLKIPANAKFPPGMKTIHEAIRLIDVAYHMNHRKNGKVMVDQNTGEMTDGIGHYGCTCAQDELPLVVTCDNPYPCAFDRGVITAVAKRLQPLAQIAHDDQKPCRKTGGNSCTYLVRW